MGKLLNTVVKASFNTCLLNNCCTKKSFKSRLKFIEEFGHTLNTVGTPSMARFNEGDLVDFKPNDREILKSEFFFSPLEIQLKYKKKFWKEKSVE
jgi:hypothetical protein